MKKPQRLIVTSFHQTAVDRFHELQPGIGLAPGIDGAARWLLSGASPGDGVVAFQVPITYDLNGQIIQVTTPSTVAEAHADGYAWHNWFSNMDSDAPSNLADALRRLRRRNHDRPAEAPREGAQELLPGAALHPRRALRLLGRSRRRGRHELDLLAAGERGEAAPLAP